MKAQLHATLLVVALLPVPGRADDGATLPAGAPPRLQLTDKRIQQAVRETLAESKDSGRVGNGRTLSGEPGNKEFARQFSEAQKPGCLHPDAMKHQPPGVTIGGWNFGVGGLLALPFWGAAILRGKCL
jgi:hypothetical protein